MISTDMCIHILNICIHAYAHIHDSSGHDFNGATKLMSLWVCKRTYITYIYTYAHIHCSCGDALDGDALADSLNLIMYIQTYIYTYTHIYIHTYMHIYIHVYIHTYIYTHCSCGDDFDGDALADSLTPILEAWDRLNPEDEA
jgi:hypothetical protein